jgi:SanA protein
MESFIKILIRACWIGSGMLLLAVLMMAFCYWWVERSAHAYTFTSVEQAPEKKVALVLGTVRELKNGYRNPYFYGRVKTAAELYHAGKVRHLLLSGDNSRRGYNEPADMRADLLDLGVPETAITLDYAGFRTFDSVIRAKEVFGQSELIVISQRFHTDRALFLARRKGIDAVAVTAPKIPYGYWKMQWRECIARTVAVLDIYLFRTKPRFLGEPVNIPNKS